MIEYLNLNTTRVLKTPSNKCSLAYVINQELLIMNKNVFNKTIKLVTERLIAEEKSDSDKRTLLIVL